MGEHGEHNGGREPHRFKHQIPSDTSSLSLPWGLKNVGARAEGFLSLGAV